MACMVWFTNDYGIYLDKMKIKHLLYLCFPNIATLLIKLNKVTIAMCLSLQVALPPDAEFVPLTKMPDTLAKEYPFILDPFQKEALLCLENNQSVLVSAHTSAGKTVVAV